jgi:hypothetical protein
MRTQKRHLATTTYIRACQVGQAAPVQDRSGSDDVQLGSVLRLLEAVDGQRGDVDRRLPAKEQVSDDLTDGGTLEKAVPGEAGRIQQPGGLWRLADEGVVVGGHLIEAGPAAGDAAVAPTLLSDLPPDEQGGGQARGRWSTAIAPTAPART